MGLSVASQTEPTVWRKASFCASGECIEVARLNDMIVMRDSKDPGRMIASTVEEFRSFVRGVQAGEFDYLFSHAA